MSLFDIQSFKSERFNKQIENADAVEDVKMEVDQQVDRKYRFTYVTEHIHGLRFDDGKNWE